MGEQIIRKLPQVERLTADGSTVRDKFLTMNDEEIREYLAGTDPICVERRKSSTEYERKNPAITIEAVR